MTSYADEDQTCAQCGHVTGCQVLMSTNTMGGPDLDLRPAEMQRSTMIAWLQECPRCRFVNGNLSDSIDGARAIIDSDEYQATLTDTDVPELALRFVRDSLLHSDDRATAGDSLLRAAWVCDDHGTSEQAASFRNRAANLLLELRPFADDDEQVTLGTALVDILRRASRPADAKELATTLLGSQTAANNDIISNVLGFQIRLCDEGDDSCHTIGEATKK